MMRKPLITLMTASLFLVANFAWAQATSTTACDLNGDGSVNSTDYNLAVNMSLGQSTCSANIMGEGVCNVVVVQRVSNAISGNCIVGNPHAVTLTWGASTSQGVTGYKVYRGTTSGGPYSLVKPAAVAGTSYIDSGVVSGRTYYYVVTAVASTGESVYSSQVSAVVPTP
jgi:fibronectin type 3 domain-containing protein